jgi:endonuclease YncB( thermonuclease family)
VSGPHAVDDTKVDANTGVGGPDVGAADARAAWFAVSSADAVRAAAWVAYTDAEAAYIAETTYTNAAAKAAAWAAYAAKAANAMAAAKAYADAETSFDAAKAAYVVAAAPRAARRALGVVAMLGAAIALVVLGLVGGAWNVRMQEPEVESSAVEVVGVTDGDTVFVMHNGRAAKIRLTGIDCPEMGQAFGVNARRFVSEQCFGKWVTIKETGTDKYGRTLGDVVLPDGTVLNQELVRAGLAWWYRQYSHDQTLAALEKEARSAKRGLWTDADAIPPWEFRHPQVQAKAGMSPDDFERRADALIATAERWAILDAGVTVYATRTGTKYHQAWCRYLSKSMIPAPLTEARKRYGPCSVCNPPR